MTPIPERSVEPLIKSDSDPYMPRCSLCGRWHYGGCGSEPLFKCEAIGCDRRADWRVIDTIGHTLRLCSHHQIVGENAGWTYAVEVLNA